MLGLLRATAVQLATGAVFGFLGPFGTWQMPAAERYGYWMIGIPLVGLLATLVLRAVVRDLLPGRSLWLQVPVASLITGVPATFLVFALETFFRQAPVHSAPVLLRLYGIVTLLLVILTLVHLGWRRQALAALTAPAPVPAPAPAPVAAAVPAPFLRRIPERLGTGLRYLAMEDHYVRVHTDHGDDLLLFRLSDAIAELAGFDGLQVHRSYWVARSAVASVERDQHRTLLVLVDGTRLPVSRTYLPALRAAGWS
jgi:hypothetical protein